MNTLKARNKSLITSIIGHDRIAYTVNVPPMGGSGGGGGGGANDATSLEYVETATTPSVLLASSLASRGKSSEWLFVITKGAGVGAVTLMLMSKLLWTGANGARGTTGGGARASFGESGLGLLAGRVESSRLPLRNEHEVSKEQ